MRIAVLGGGPGGLLAALLAKRSDPGREVTVFERNRAGDTFGFGVVFSDATLDGIDAADPVLRRALTEHGVHWDPIEVRLRGERWRFGGNGMAAVARQTLLSLLQQRAHQAGVDLRFSAPAQPDDLLSTDCDRAGYDLVIAADGANSLMRARFGEVFGPRVVTATAKFIWFGTTYRFDGLTFVHEQSPHGVFAVHGYPIGNGVSTFIVETDEPSWRAAGLDRFDVSQPPGPSDEVTPDPGRGPALAVLVGALRPVLPAPAAVAVRLPLLQPLPAGVQAAPARRGVRGVGARGLAGRPRRDRTAAHPGRHRGRGAAEPGDPGGGRRGPAGGRPAAAGVRAAGGARPMGHTGERPGHRGGHRPGRRGGGPRARGGRLPGGGRRRHPPDPATGRRGRPAGARRGDHARRGRAPGSYYRAPEQNARAFTPDGWYASGDVVRRRPDGNLVVEGRDKDMINRGGEKISAEEVENLVYRMPGIAQVAAVAAPDAELGERICVFVVPQPGQDITLDAIRDGMAAAGVARFKWPERLELMAELPVTKVGKLDKKALRDMLALGSAEHQARLAELYRDFEAAGMTPLWLTREGLMPFHPQPRAVPHLWRWTDLLPLAARSAELVPVGRGGERRAISLGNPGLSGDPYTTPTLWAAIQYLAPREDAPEHRHSQSAFRFVLQGEGVWTVVDGDPVAMRRGDLLLTPGWAFHGHQNVSDTPMAWLDGLDIPLVAETDQGFFEFGPDQVRTRATPERSHSERLWGGPGLTPVALAGTRPASPLVAYRWAHTDAALTAQLELEEEGVEGVLEPGHAAVRYTNPTSGGDALTTMRTEFHRLRAGAATRPSRTSASSVWQVFDGAGSVRLNDQQRPLERGDIIAVPAWTEFALQAASQLDLFTFSDAPVFEKLNLLRTGVS